MGLASDNFTAEYLMMMRYLLVYRNPLGTTNMVSKRCRFDFAMPLSLNKENFN